MLKHIKEKLGNHSNCCLHTWFQRYRCVIGFSCIDTIEFFINRNLKAVHHLKIK